MIRGFETPHSSTSTRSRRNQGESGFRHPQVDNIDEIVEVDGIDVVYVGPTDLSISLGVAGDVFHPRVEAAAKRIRDAAEWRGVPVANVIYNPFDRTEIERKIGEGYKLFSVFLDVQLFRQSLERLYDEVRAAL